MSLDETKARATASAAQVKAASVAMRSAARSVEDAGQNAAAYLGSHNTMPAVAAATRTASRALEQAAYGCRDAAQAVEDWVNSNF